MSKIKPKVSGIVNDAEKKAKEKPGEKVKTGVSLSTEVNEQGTEKYAFDPRIDQCPHCDLKRHGKCVDQSPLKTLKPGEKCGHFKPEPKGMHDDEREQHPMYGMLSASRVTTNPSTSLIGSGVKHHSFIVFELHTAERTRSLHHEKFFSKKLIAKFAVSPVQFVELLTGMNTSGTPCTLEFYRAPGTGEPVVLFGQDVPGDETVPKTVKEFDEQVDVAAAHINEVKNRVEALADKHKTVGKGVLREIAKALDHASAQVDANMTFIRDTFIKQVKSTVADAKSEVEAFAEAVVHRTGVDVLKGNMPQLPESTTKLIEAEEVDGEEE